MPPAPEDVRNGRKAKLSSNDGGPLEAAHRFWQTSYAGDYLGLAVVATLLLLIRLLSEPFPQTFILSDTRIQHPWTEVERVSTVQLFLYAAALPLLVITLWTAFFRPNDRHKIHPTLLGLAISILTASLLTHIVKDAVGRPRPDLISRCNPELSAPRHELIRYDDYCQETDHHKLHDGWRSFPSGHASFAFAGLGWLALFFASQTHVLRPRASQATVLLCLAPLIGAALIAISRLEDYRHDVADVIFGSILGFVVAYFNWRRYYPRLTEQGCDEPHPPPGSESRRGSPGYQRAARDEEEGPGGGESRYGLGDEGNGGGGGGEGR